MRKYFNESYVQPAVRKWLRQRGYEYECEVWLAGSKYRADVIATHKETGEVLIVECKRNCSTIEKAIAQVQRYRNVYNPNAKIAIATHRDTITQKARNLCSQHNVLLIGVIVAGKGLEPTVHSRFWDSFVPLPSPNKTPLTPEQLAAVFGDVDRAREIWWNAAKAWMPKDQDNTDTGGESNAPTNS